MYACAYTSFVLWLRGQVIDTVVISGYMTQMCCDTTARQALHLGFSVEFLSDATGTLQIMLELLRQRNYTGQYLSHRQ